MYNSIHFSSFRKNLWISFMYYLNAFLSLLPSADEVWGKVIFLHLFVSLFTGGGLPQCMLGYPPGPGPPTRPPPGPGPPRTRHPPGTEHAGRYGQRAGGTHPTGMQSCFLVLSQKVWKSLRVYSHQEKATKMKENFRLIVRFCSVRMQFTFKKF